MADPCGWKQKELLLYACTTDGHMHMVLRTPDKPTAIDLGRTGERGQSSGQTCFPDQKAGSPTGTD